MKKLLITVGLLFGFSAFSQATSIGEVGRDIRDNTKFTLLESGQPSYFFNVKEGRNEAAVTTSIFSYRYLTSDIGWIGGYDSKTVGSILLGGQLHIIEFIKQTFPEFVEVLASLTPDSIDRIADKIRVGPAVGYGFSESEWKWGILAGLEVKF